MVRVRRRRRKQDQLLLRMAKKHRRKSELNHHKRRASDRLLKRAERTSAEVITEKREISSEVEWVIKTSCHKTIGKYGNVQLQPNTNRGPDQKAFKANCLRQEPVLSGLPLP